MGEQQDNPKRAAEDARNEGKETYDMDVDRMINEGLGGGIVSMHNGLIEETTTDTMTEDGEP